MNFLYQIKTVFLDKNRFSITKYIRIKRQNCLFTNWIATKFTSIDTVSMAWARLKLYKCFFRNRYRWTHLRYKRSILCYNLLNIQNECIHKRTGYKHHHILMSIPQQDRNHFKTVRSRKLSVFRSTVYRQLLQKHFWNQDDSYSL